MAYGAKINRLCTRCLECLIGSRVNRAILPSFKKSSNERLFRLNQVKAMSEVEELLQGQVRYRTPVPICFVQYEIANGARIEGAGSGRDRRMISHSKPTPIVHNSSTNQSGHLR